MKSVFLLFPLAVSVWAQIFSFPPPAGGSSSAGNTVSISNAASTGTTVNTLTKVTGSPSTAVIGATADLGGVVGITTSGAGTTGSAVIQISGLATCVFSNATTAGNYVQISTTTNGACADSGFSTFPSNGGQVVGRVLSTNASAGTYQIQLFAPEIQSTAVVPHIPVVTQGCGTGAGASQSSITCTFGTSIRANSQLLVCVNDQNGNAITWSGDSGTFTSNVSFATGGGWNTRCSTVSTTGGGGTTITATAALNFPVIAAVELRATGIDQSDAGASSSSTTAASSSVTTATNANELAIGVIITQAGGSTITPTNSFASITNAFGNSSNNVAMRLESRTLTAITTLAATATVGSASWGAHIVTFY